MEDYEFLLDVRESDRDDENFFEREGGQECKEWQLCSLEESLLDKEFDWEGKLKKERPLGIKYCFYC